jgi:hypothetical protein
MKHKLVAGYDMRIFQLCIRIFRYEVARNILDMDDSVLGG